MLIQHNKFYIISNRSGVAQLIWTVTDFILILLIRFHLTLCKFSRVFGGSTMPAQHTRSTGLLCGRPVASQPSTREIRILAGTVSDIYRRSIIYTVLKHLAY